MATPAKSSKPAKPYPSFPLFPHATKMWCKKIKGKLIYFGPWDDPDAALAKYLDEKDDLHAGRTPRQRASDGPIIRGLLNRFLATKEDAVSAGELTARTFHDYRSACERIARVFGLNRFVDDLVVEDFATLKRELGKTMQPLTVKVQMQRVRAVFRYAYDAGLIDKPVRYGPGFKSPNRKVIAKSRRDSDLQMFSAAEIRLMRTTASLPLKTMILLGINCGFGNNDCATLTLDSVDAGGGWRRHARPKTQARRRCPLWRETVTAIQEAIDAPPTPNPHFAQAIVTRSVSEGRATACLRLRVAFESTHWPRKPVPQFSANRRPSLAYASRLRFPGEKCGLKIRRTQTSFS